MKPVLFLTGQRFGRYTVIGEAVRRKTNRYWTCRCDCGTIREVPQSSLTSGQSTSCGCYQREWTRTHKPARRHGHTSNKSVTPEYRAWQNMNRRCHDPGFGEYTRYGQRGVMVADEWRRGTPGAFEAFLQAVGPRPDGCSLERNNNDGPYAPGNVRWATSTEQANNRSTNTRITLDGETKTLAQWCRERGIKPGTVMSRLLRGWTVERALTEVVGKWTRR